MVNAAPEPNTASPLAPDTCATLQKVRLLSELVDAVASAGDLKAIYEHALDGLHAALGIDRSAILLLDDRRVARFVAWRGLSDDYRRVAEGHFPWPVDAPDPPPLAVSDCMADPSLVRLYDNFRSENIGALAFIPLVYDRRLLGKFMVYFATPHEFTAEELALARTIGRLIAFAVERTKLEAALREAARRKDEFLAMLAHELRNPLGALAASLELTEQAPGAKGERDHALAKRQVQHLSRMVDDLLDLSRVTRGLVDLRKEPVELSTVVAGAVESVRPLLDRMHHELLVSVPARRLVADPVRLEQIITNLLSNAAKYTPPYGNITVSATSEPERVVLRVRDTGVGIAADLLPRVFDMFAQGERSLARSGGGLGIGLTLVKELVAQHGGTITASSDGPGKGSEFVVTIPTPRVEAKATETSPRELTAPPPETPALGGGAHVLLVDDNIDLVTALAELLRSWGHVVDVETSGMGALRAIGHAVPDVVILDIGLPELDGYEVARRLRAIPQLAGTPLVAISGYGQPNDLRRSREAGFTTHMVKPLDIALLRQMLERRAFAQNATAVPSPPPG